VSRSTRSVGRTALRRELRRLARALADQVVELLDTHGLWDEQTSDREQEPLSARRIRRSADALADVGKRLLGELGRHAEPVAISTLAAALGVSTRAIAHPLTRLVEQGLVARTGERRGTRYQLRRIARGSVRPQSAAKRPAAKRPAAKRTRTGRERVARRART
jgi:DNA-binding transcriptional ArsR family regulator